MEKSEAIAHFGSVIKLAQALHMTPQGVYQWRRGVPLHHQFVLERLTNGALKAKMPEKVAPAPEVATDPVPEA